MPTRKSPLKKAPDPMRKQRLQLLLALNVIVWIAALAASAYKLRLSAKPPITIQLATDPKTIRLTIDGERYGDGAYVDTPMRLLVAPGQHRLKIFRDGYIAHVVTVRGGPGETYKMDDVVLQKNPTVPFAALSITLDQETQPLHVEIDDGLARGDAPLETRDVPLGAEHVLTIYPQWPELEPRSRCRFVVEGDVDGTEYEITIAAGRNGRVRVRGCEALTKKKP